MLPLRVLAGSLVAPLTSFPFSFFGISPPLPVEKDVRLRQTITSSPGSTNVTFEAVNGRARPVEVTLDVDVDSGNIEDVVDFGIYTERPFKAQIQPGETGLIASVHVRAAIGINWGFREIAPSSGPASPAE